MRANLISALRSAIVAVAAVAAVVLVVRNGLVAAYAESNPARAAAIWPSHPDIRFRIGLARVGETAAAGGAVGRDSIAPLLLGARAAPLAPEPFLVRGVELRLAGDEAGAGRAFTEARKRDPRSVAARFFLADHYLRAGDARRGLSEVATLSRLVPGSEVRLAPILAAYAKEPGAAPQVRAVLRAHPELEQPLLQLLAPDAGNADLMLMLASPHPPGSAALPWQGKLLESLVGSGQYARAYAVWSRFMGEPATAGRALLFDPRFERLTAPPPFAWTLASGGAGLVEPGKGGLHIIYYGRDNVEFAKQTLLLAPGTYALAMKAAGGGPAASSLAWTLTCLPSKTVIMAFDMSRAGGTHRFAVPPAGCTAQHLALSGKAPDFPETADVTFSGLSLARVAQ